MTQQEQPRKRRPIQHSGCSMLLRHSMATLSSHTMYQVRIHERTLTGNFSMYKRQPPRSDGTYTYPGQVLRLDKAQQGTPDAGYRWEVHRNRVCKRLGWTALKSEPSAYLICRGTAYTQMLASTDVFIVASNCPVFLKEQREAFKREWNITLPDLVSQHAGVKI
jgi:hypothetical protein